jgi:hypothetical protein
LGKGGRASRPSETIPPVVAVIAEQHKPGEYADRSAAVGADPQPYLRNGLEHG